MPKSRFNIKNKIESSALLTVILASLEELKASQVVVMDMQPVKNAAYRYMVVCTANSSTHAAAIANNVEKHTLEKLKEKPWHVEGLEVSRWVLVDYISIVLNIFLESERLRYAIEQLWGDAMSIEVSYNQ